MKLFLMAAIGAGVLQAEWKVGAAAVKITPGESIWMAGYAARNKPSDGVLHDIWVKAVAFEDETGAKAVAVTLDLVGIRKTMADSIAGTVRSKHGIARERLWFNASHTHSAPLVTEGASTYDFGSYGASQAPVLRRYYGFVEARISEAIDHAIGKLAPATLHFEQGLAGFAVNRRRVGHRDYPGPVDHDVPVLVAKNRTGDPVLILFGYACHNTVLSGYEINGDYAGFAQSDLEQRYPGSVALFVEGAGADANPLPRRTVELARRYGRTLADAVSEVMTGKMKPLTGTLKTALVMTDLRFAGPFGRERWEREANAANSTERRHGARILAMLDGGRQVQTAYSYPVQAWNFGGQLLLLAFGGELVADYALRFKAKYGWDTTWVAGYSNDVFGYVPSLRVLREGGYEGGGAMLFGTLPGPFAEDVEESIANATAAAVSAVR
jgi:hypothetical protein